MRPRGQTPRMHLSQEEVLQNHPRFNEAAGADPADALCMMHIGIYIQWGFNEAAGADPADATGDVVLQQVSFRLLQ